MIRALSPLKAVLFLLSFLCSPTSAVACVGPPPEPVCGKNLTLALAGPPTTVLTSGGVFDVSALVYLALLDFPQGLGACPVGPYTVSIAVTASCTPGPDGSGQVLGQPVNSGFNEITVPVTIPAGPARHCTLAATATVLLLDAMVLTETADNVLCVVDSAAGAPSEPRLGIELLGPAGSEIARKHPGDQAATTYRITNNDPAETFSGGLTADMLNEARMPGMSGSQPPGTGVFSISDPVQGDNFDIAFDGGLIEGSVPLSSDPLRPEIPSIVQAIELAPGESTDITIYSRSWGMCADGSCGRSTVTVGGEFSDQSQGLACSGFVLAADSAVSPDYDWPDSGEVGEVPEPDNPAEPKLKLTGEPSAGVPVEILIEILQVLLSVGGQPAGIPIVTADRLNSERGRIQMQYLGDFPFDAEIGFVGGVQVSSLDLDDGFETERVSRLNGPTGFETRAPSAEILTRITDTKLQVDSFFDLTTQVTVTGIDALGERRPFDFGNIQFVRKVDGSGWDVVLGNGLLNDGTGNDLLAIEVSMDLRGFVSPEPQGGLIFEDGFESGNVSRWSASNP